MKYNYESLIHKKVIEIVQSREDIYTCRNRIFGLWLLLQFMNKANAEGCSIKTINSVTRKKIGFIMKSNHKIEMKLIVKPCFSKSENQLFVKNRFYVAGEEKLWSEKLVKELHTIGDSGKWGA